MLIIAIDLGKFNSVACLYNTQTQKQQFETLATDRGFFETLFKTYNPIGAVGSPSEPPKLLRTLLVECAWCSLQYNQWSRETYDWIHAGKQPRKKKAAVATARRILVLTWAMMRNGTDYDAKRNITPTKEKTAA